MKVNFAEVAGYNNVPTVIVNTTPHMIRFKDHDGNIVEIPSDSNYIINAKAVEEDLGNGLVTTKFIGTNEGEALIEQIQKEARDYLINAYGEVGRYFELRIVGSIIAAQAYPMKVVGMTPYSGYERVAPAEKLMSTEKFTVYL